MRNFQQLSTWQRSHLFTFKIYSVTKNFPKDEMFGIISHMRRHLLLSQTNIAEGCGRNSNPENETLLNNCNWVLHLNLNTN
jgi:four helix bundle protein